MLATRRRSLNLFAAGWQRLGILLVAVVVVGLLVSVWAPPWLAYVVWVLLIGSFVTQAVSRVAPMVLDAILTDAPLTVLAGADRAKLFRGWSMALPCPLPEQGRPVGRHEPMEVRSWVASAGGADVGTTFLKLVLEGNSSATVLLTDVRVVVTSRESPISETRVTYPAAGDVTVHGIGFDLDETTPVARAIEDDSMGPAGVADPSFARPFFDDHHWTLSKGEVLVFNVVANTRRSFCEWHLQLDLVVGGSPAVMSLMDRGQPFRTSARRKKFDKSWNWVWYEPGDERFVEIDQGGLHLMNPVV